MRTQLDSTGTLERVRKKVATLKQNLRLAERKIKEARESIPKEGFRKALGFRFRHDVLAKGSALHQPAFTQDQRFGRKQFKHRPPRIQPQTRKCEDQQDGSSGNSMVCVQYKQQPDDTGSGVLKTDINGNIIVVENQSEDDETQDEELQPLSPVTRKKLRRMSSRITLVRRQSSDTITKSHAMHGRVINVGVRLNKARLRIRAAEKRSCELKEELRALIARVAEFQEEKKRRQKAKRDLKTLEKRLAVAAERAAKVEDRESELEVKVMELEDAIEAYQIKQQRGRYLLNCARGDIKSTDAALICMMMRRSSLSSQSFAKITAISPRLDRDLAPLNEQLI